MRLFEYLIPNYGDSIILVILCDRCKFKVVDVIPKEAGKSKRIEIKVESREDLRKKVVKGREARIEIPEIGLVAEESEGYISTVEGILLRLERKIKENSREVYERIKEDLEDLKKVKRKFRIILEDPEGISRIIL